MSSTEAQQANGAASDSAAAPIFTATPIASCRINGDHIVACPTEQYEEQLQRKLATLTTLIPAFPAKDIEVFRSPPVNYRNRANFNIWRDKRGDDGPTAMYYAMWDTKEAKAAVVVGTAGMTKKQRKQARYDQKVPQKELCEISSFPRGTTLINALMADLLTYLREQDQPAVPHAAQSLLLRHQLFEVRFVTTQTQEAIVVLIYHCPLEGSAWCAAASGLAAWLQRPASAVSQRAGALKVVGRARKQKFFVSSQGSSMEEDDDKGGSAEKVTLENLQKELITEEYRVHGQPYKNHQVEGAFSQPNAAVCQLMLAWSVECTGAVYDHNNPAESVVRGPPDMHTPAAAVRAGEDLAELYCGGGTFTAPLARNFRSVLATELSKASVVLAKKAFADNGVSNVTVAPVSAEDFSDMYAKFLRCKENKTVFTGGNIGHSGSVQGITNLGSFDNISTVFVDPPRAGCDDATCALLARFDKICYISCNPETLARDVAKITAIVGPGTSTATASASGTNCLYRHKVVRMAAFDQFPYTPHLEGGVMLVKQRVPDGENREEKKEEGAEPVVGEKRPLDI